MKPVILALLITPIFVASAVTASALEAQAAPAIRSTAGAPADTATERRLVTAVVDSTLAALSRGDLVGFTDYMVDEAITMSIRNRDGQLRHAAQTRLANRSMSLPGRVTERAFGTQVRVAGPIATAWAPYDFYIDDKWSHCGVDVFTLLKTGGTWKIATLVWSVEQPPACQRHPDGPPKQ